MRFAVLFQTSPAVTALIIENPTQKLNFKKQTQLTNVNVSQK